MTQRSTLSEPPPGFTPTPYVGQGAASDTVSDIAAVELGVGQLISKVIGKTARNLAWQDKMLLGLQLFLSLRVALAPPSDQRTKGIIWMALLAAAALTNLVLVRGEIIRSARARALFYRFGIPLPSITTYFALRHILIAIEPKLWDHRFLEIDQFLFAGQTPAVWLDPFVTLKTTEWFAFFYSSYFFLLLYNIVGSMFFSKGRQLQENILGMACIVTFGHCLYTIFPGYGPHVMMSFATPLPTGFWMSRVLDAVYQGGAFLDIMPSLHTAYPTFFALHAWRHREHLLYRYVWPMMMFFAINIIIATLFLRWHYGVDVIAGIALAVFAFAMSIWDSGRNSDAVRDRQGKQRVWESLCPKEK